MQLSFGTPKPKLVLAPHNGTDTSIAAAIAIAPEAKRQRDRVLAFIAGCGYTGATDQEIEEGTGIVNNTVRPRRGELERDGLIKLTDRRRPTRSGRPARVYVATTEESRCN
jgi:predicted ArsR family transcriptional regulator